MTVESVQRQATQNLVKYVWLVWSSTLRVILRAFQLYYVPPSLRQHSPNEVVKEHYEAGKEGPHNVWQALSSNDANCRHDSSQYIGDTAGDRRYFEDPWEVGPI